MLSEIIKAKSILKLGSTGGGSTGGGINYMGEISLAPEINYYSVQNFTDIGCSTVVNVDDSVTITPDDPLVTIPNLNNGIGTGFIVLAKDIAIPTITQNEMSFIWPDLSLDVTGGTSFYIVIYNSSVSDEDLIAGFQMSPSAEIFATILAVELYDGTPSNVYSFNKVGKGDPINYKTFTIPTAGDKIYLEMYSDGYIYISSPMYTQYLSLFPLRYLPEGDNLSIAFMYSTDKASTDLASFEFDFTPRVGNSGFMQIAETIPVTIPSEAIDGDIYKCTARGRVGNTFVHEGDSFILIDDKTDCIPIHCENTIKSIASKIADASAEFVKSSIGLGPYNPYNSVSDVIYVECQPSGQIYNAIQAAITP